MNDLKQPGVNYLSKERKPFCWFCCHLLTKELFFYTINVYIFGQDKIGV